MANPLYNELLELRYIPIDKIDEELPPESVVLYFKNLSQLDKRVSVEPIHGVQLDLLHQNPTIELEDFKATFCLGPSIYIPTVTITPIVDYVDPQYPVSLTVTGTISRTETNIPNEILVSYNNQTKTATLTNNTDWTVTFDLKNVTLNSTELVTARGNSLDINTSIVSDFSETVERRFNITITPEVDECIPSVDKVSCLCLDPSKMYKVTVDDESFTGSFDNVVAFLDSHGLYAYPGGFDCDPCFGSRNRYSLTTISEGPPPASFMAMSGPTTLANNDHTFTITEQGKDPIEVTLPAFVVGKQLLTNLLELVTDLAINTTEAPNKTVTTFKNILDVSRSIKFTTTEASIKALGTVTFDGGIELNKTANSFTLCFSESQPIACNSSTSPYASFQGFSQEPIENLRIVCNGVPVTQQDLENNTAPFSVSNQLGSDLFVNKTEQCLLIEFLYDGPEIFFPASSTPGAESESLPNVFRLSLAGQVFTTPRIRIEFKDGNTPVYNVLTEGKTYTVVVSLVDTNPNPAWEGTITTASGNHTLTSEAPVSFSVNIPENDTWFTKPYVYDFDITSDTEFVYETDSNLKPEKTISVISLPGSVSTWTYNNVVENVPNSPNNPHFYYADKTLAKQGILTIQLPSAYAGLKTGAPFNATVNGGGLLTVDLGQSYAYNEGWTTANRIGGSIHLQNSEGTSVAFLAYYTYVSGFDLAIESASSSGTFTSTTNINHKVNQPFTRFKLGPFPNVSKVSLTVHQDGLGNARLVRETTILDVVSNYAYYTPPTPTVTYNPYVDEWSYKITTLLIRVEEGDPRFLSMMRQSKELKYTVTT